MSQIILLNPYYSQMKEFSTFVKPSAPMGLMYLAAYLEKHGLESKIIELGVFDSQQAISLGKKIRFGLSDQAIVKILKAERPRIVGLTSMYSVYYRDVLEIAALVKKYQPQAKVVLGGNHPSLFYRYLLKDKNVDLVVIGEGEVTFFEVCQAILAGRNDWSKIKGVAYRRGRGVTKTPSRELIRNLDEVPFPARHLVDFDRYLIKPQDSPYPLRYPGTSIVTSRGCPGNCIYCTVGAVWGRTWRGRSPQNVIEEIKLLQERYGIRELAVMDDSASVDRERWERICELIAKENIDLKWTVPNGIAHWHLKKSTLRKMWRAGCYRVTFGIESGDPKIRKYIGKPFSLAQAKQLIKYANGLGMWTICTFILGFMDEEMTSIQDTVNFAKESGSDFAIFYQLMPYPATRVYQDFRQEGLVNFDRFFQEPSFDSRVFQAVNKVLNETGADTKFFKKEELREIKRKAYRSFLVSRVLSYLVSPRKILVKIKTKEDFFYLLKMIRVILTFFWRLIKPVNLRTYEYLFDRNKGVVR